MSILVDTNILLRWMQPAHPSHVVAVEGVARLLGVGEPVYFTFQNISELWNVARDPSREMASDFRQPWFLVR